MLDVRDHQGDKKDSDLFNRVKWFTYFPEEVPEEQAGGAFKPNLQRNHIVSSVLQALYLRTGSVQLRETHNNNTH